jgi:folate-binding protein YgfZ
VLASVPDYEAATKHAAFIDRSSRLRLAVRGRAPEQVLTGLVSGRVPPLLAGERPGVRRGRGEGSALLTPKGRMLAVLRLLRGGPAPEDGFLLDLPRACAEAALEHLRKYVPPRLATVEDVSHATGMLTVLGPRAAEVVARVAAPALDRGALDALGDGDLLEAVTADGGLTAVRTAAVATSAFDLFGPAERVARLGAALVDAEVMPLTPSTWDVLRVEAGEPEFGVDMDDTTIPVEAGIHTRVVDYGKGCFTGQEVLIRIRDRGHVNRLLRALRFGEGLLPVPGSELFVPGEERTVGRVTSAVRSPRFGAVGLGYVRREVSPPAELRLGGPDGPPAAVESSPPRPRPDGGSS